MAYCVKKQTFTSFISAVGKKVCNTFVLKITYWKWKHGQYATWFLVEAPIKGFSHKMEMDVLESEMVVEKD